jgi:hypothetical protein
MDATGWAQDNTAVIVFFDSASPKEIVIEIATKLHSALVG